MVRVAFNLHVVEFWAWLQFTLEPKSIVLSYTSMIEVPEKLWELEVLQPDS
jgi:hypothetical protein